MKKQTIKIEYGISSIDQVAVGAFLTKQRISLGLTQNQIANALGLHSATYSDYERGRVDLPLSKLYLLSILLRFNLDTFIMHITGRHSHVPTGRPRGRPKKNT